MIIIYYLHKGDNIPFYIGKTKNKSLHRNYQHKYTYGDNTVLEILDEVNPDDWNFWEKHYISLFKSWGFVLDNKNNGGGGPLQYNNESKLAKSKSLKKLWDSGNFHRKLGKQIQNIKTGKIYKSCKEAASDLSLNVNTITTKCKKGIELKYIDNWKFKPSKHKIS
jgi:hypothetical protein